MSLNPISTLNTINEITSSEDVLMIMDASDTETKQILISEFNTTIQSTTLPLSGSFSGSFQGDGSSLTGVTGEWDGSHLGDASITGSLTVSGSTSTVDFSNVEGGVSGSFSGSYSGSFSGDGSGLFNVTIESASYIQSTGVDGPYGMDSILSASYAISSSSTISSSYALSSSYSVSSSYSISSSYAVSSSYAISASHYSGEYTSLFNQTSSFYATTNDLQVTGSLDISGSFSSNTYDIDSGGDTTVEGILNTQGGTKTKVRRITLDGTTSPTIQSSDNIVYIDVTAVGGIGTNNINIPNIKGQEIILLVKNPSNLNFYIFAPSALDGNFLNGDTIPQPPSVNGLNLNNFNQSELSFDTVNYPTYAKYHIICIESGRTNRYLMNVNFGKIYSR